MSPNPEFDMRDFQMYINGQRLEPTPIVSATGTITSDEIRNAIYGIDATGQVYINNLYHYHNDSVDAVRYVINDINTTRDYARDVERDKIIEVLKREKNVNTKKCMYVDDLVKEIAKIMGVHL